MKSFRQISSPFLAMMVAGIGVWGLIVWWTFRDPSAGRTGDSGGIAPTDSSGGAVTQAAATPPWASEEQKSKAEEREERRRKKFELYAELTKGLPELQPKLDGIPAFEVNGFERLLALASAREEDLRPVPYLVLAMLKDALPWDSLAVEEYLNRQKGLFAELETISRLPAGEVNWWQHHHFLSRDYDVWDFMAIEHALCLAAKDALHKGNPKEAINSLELMDRMSWQLRVPKDAMGLFYIRGIGLHFQIRSIVPQVAKLAGNDTSIYPRLETLLANQSLTPADVARFYRGAIVSDALGSTIPWLQDDSQSLELYASGGTKSLLRYKFEIDINKLEAMHSATSFEDLMARMEKLARAENIGNSLSAEERTMIDSVSPDPQINYFVLSETHRQMTRAAVRLARDDKAPETILSEIAASEPEPRKLHYDTATRTLTSEPFLTETEKISIQVP